MKGADRCYHEIVFVVYLHYCLEAPKIEVYCDRDRALERARQFINCYECALERVQEICFSEYEIYLRLGYSTNRANAYVVKCNVA